MNESDKNGKHLKGVSCDACHCIYNGEDNCCHANEIAVGPHNACSSSETICATFKPKESEEIVGN